MPNFYTSSWSALRYTVLLGCLQSFVSTAPSASNGQYQLDQNGNYAPTAVQVAYSILELELQPDKITAPGILPALKRGFQIDGVRGSYADLDLGSTQSGE